MRVKRSRTTLYSLKVKWGYISAQKVQSERSKGFCCVHFTAKQGHQELNLESPGLENIPQVPENQAKVGQNHDARKTGSATLSDLKWSGAIFRLRSSKGERLKCFALSISMQTKAIGS